MVQGYEFRWAYERPGPEEGQRDEPKRGAGGTRIPCRSHSIHPILGSTGHRSPRLEAALLNCPMLAKKVLLRVGGRWRRRHMQHPQNGLPTTVFRSPPADECAEKMVWLAHLSKRFVTGWFAHPSRRVTGPIGFSGLAQDPTRDCNARATLAHPLVSVTSGEELSTRMVGTALLNRSNQTAGSSGQHKHRSPSLPAHNPRQLQ
ncbi:hypothetical protein QBC41DRAFT_339570 [Cercophora samala]|uniref:Uncharacterized protein n=1 Tax=Cercophora samala TaxID=330535 RepID=A0AA39Z7V2_9PEZI|nr:hypothetical protein QBC41DRAFT_339570 [Cercophora samala]